MDLNEVDDFEDGLEKEVSEQGLSEDSSYVNQDALTSEDLNRKLSENNLDIDYDDTSTAEDEDLITSLLKSKGINPDAIKFENNLGVIETQNFKNLSKEDLLLILNSSDLDFNYGLSDNEVNFINTLRYNNLSIEDYSNYVANLSILNYLKELDTQNFKYQVDSISDDELFLADLKSRIPDITENEALIELNLAKENDDLYLKKIESLRSDYKTKEDDLILSNLEELKKNYEQQQKQFEDVIINTIQNNDSINLGDSSLTLSAEDKNDIASCILDTDAAGVRYIAKALDDPTTLVKMVWYALKGEEAFGQISDYYKTKISETAKFNYNRGFEDAKLGKTANSYKSVVKKSTAHKTNKPLTIDDLD